MVFIRMCSIVLNLERKTTILEAANYLLNNFDAIHICTTASEARNGGATEPHASHVLSSRLSSRPMGWSPKTLKKFVTILEAVKCTFCPTAPEGTKFKRNTKSTQTPDCKNCTKFLGVTTPGYGCIHACQAGKSYTAVQAA